MLAHLARWTALSGASADRCAALAERSAAAGMAASGALPYGDWFHLVPLLLCHAERFDVVLSMLDWAERAALERGSSAHFALARLRRSTVHRLRGQLLDAEADATTAVEATEAAGAADWVRAQPYLGLLQALADRGHLDEAQAGIERLGLSEKVPEARAFTSVLIARGVVRHERGELEAALRDLEEADRRIRRFGPASMSGQDGRLRRALIRQKLGDATGADAVAHEALEIARRWGTPGAIGSALRIRGLLDKDIATVREALSHLARSELRLEHARALADLGAALRRSNARADARVPLREALEIARDCGADGLASLIEQELEATGVHVPARPGRGAAALTPSEARVAHMAAEGLSNKDIAQALFVTVKTVEMHLGNTYRKLDVRSRRELPQALV